jgi:hypothetical protein
VALEIVYDDDVIGLQSPDEDFLDVSSNALAVDRAKEDRESVDPVMTRRGQEGRGLPVVLRDLGGKPNPAPCPASAGSYLLTLVQVSSMKTKRSGAFRP